ncbi:MAG: DNA polymerase-3 subunit beta [Spirosomataceae bacterium]|jgi:DNA polymerase-3 subunit beta
MKFIVSSSSLLKSLSTVNGVIASNPIVPILENFLFELSGSVLTITASDMHTVMQTSVMIESGIDGSITVPAKMILDTLRSLPEQPVTLKVDTDTFGLELVTANGHFKLSGENPLDFPRIPEVTRNFGITLPSDILGLAISNTLFATSTDDLRPAMTGVYMQVSGEHTTFVATDGHRLIRYRREDITTENTTTLILPRKALNLLKSSLPSGSVDVKAEFSNSNAFFSFDNIKMVSRLIDERYPDYENVIPKENPNKMLIERNSFLSTLKRIAIYSNKTTHQIRLKISADELEISAEDLDYSNEAKEKITCEYMGDPMEIGFNAKFLIEMLSNLDASMISMNMSLPNRAGLIVPVEKDENEDILMLVMPVMLNTYA